MAAGLAFSIIGTAMPAKAADKNANFSAKGVGVLTCGELLQALDSNEQNGLVLFGWIDGYVTAANQHIDGLFDAVPWQQVQLLGDLLIAHCDANKDQRFLRAMELMLDAMSPTSLTIKSEIEIIETGDGKTVAIYREILRKAQERLIGLGHLAGGADGKYGPKTAAGFAAFQKAGNLQINSLPDQATLLALFTETFNAR